MSSIVDPLDDSASRNAATCWAAISTHPHRETIATENLLRQNFQVYFPRELKRVRHARRIQNVMRPLFPGYLFVQVMPESAMWRPILSTVGVRTLVRIGERPSLIDSGFIDALRAREIDGVIARPAAPYQLGQQVRLNGGALDGLIGQIIAMKDEERLTLLTHMLQRQVRMKVTSADVRPL